MRTVAVIDGATGHELAVLSDMDGLDAVLSPDGRHLVASSDMYDPPPRSLRLVDASTGAVLRDLGAAREYTDVRFRDDGPPSWSPMPTAG